MRITSKIRNRKTISVFLSAVLGVNTFAMLKVSTHGSDVPDLRDVQNDIINKASGYLEMKRSEDNSYGDSRTINDTVYALKALRKAGKSGYDGSISWLAEKTAFDNTDMTARLASASGEKEYLSKLETKQNKDGGFGLYQGYESAVLDSLLVLEAINETGYSGKDISGSAVCSYLFSEANNDGGYSYAEKNQSDPLLTAAVTYNVGRFLSTGSKDMTGLKEPLSYISGNISDSYTDSGIEKTICKYLAYQAAGEKFDAVSVVKELKDAEWSDGSFAGNIRTTSMAVELLSSLDIENQVNVTSFNTSLSKTESRPGSAVPVKAVTKIGYTSSCDAELDLKFTVYCDGNPVYENVSKAALSKDDSTMETEAGEFRINVHGRELYAVAELYNGEVLLKSQRIDMTVTEDEKVYSSEFSRLSVRTDRNIAYTGSDTEVRVASDLLYAVNKACEAKICTRIVRDGEEKGYEESNVTLLPEKTKLTSPAVSFTADTSKPGVYEIESVCIYEGREILKSSTEFRVVDVPVFGAHAEGEEPQFEIAWFGPVLSDYYVYAGSEKMISAGIELNYISGGTFRGKAELSVHKGDETIAENSFDVELEKSELINNDLRIAYPVYRNEDQLSFKADELGEYKITGRFYDSFNKLLKEETRSVYVVEKPVQDLIMNSSVNSEKENMIDITWNDISNEADSYSYQMSRRVNGGQWEPRSIWNEEEHIRVLNVYPRQPYLVEWLNSDIGDTGIPAGKGIFEIETASFSQFNKEPEKYLYNDDGSWKCDVIFFGASDSNSYIDLEDKSEEEVHKFVDSGRGVLFGHDTICRAINNEHFCTFAEEAGLFVENKSKINRSSYASVIKIGTLTNYPWVIRGDLNIPETHSYGQYIVDATEWLTLNTEKVILPDTGYRDGFYLCTKNNLAMIQTGHSTGAATDDERKVLANTLFYLYQISRQTTAKDASFYDTDAPDKPELISSESRDGKVTVTVKSADNPTDYEYYITATPDSQDSDSVLSNISKHTAFSDLAGFVIKTSGSAEEDPELLEYNENRDRILGIVPADGSGTAVLTTEPTDLSQSQYIHIFAVDNAGNVSEEYIMPFADSSITAKISTDRENYSYGDTVRINTETISSPFGRTADMKIEITGGSGLAEAELVSEKNKEITAGEKLESSAEWEIPANTTGRFDAVITWIQDDKVIAEDSTSFRITNGESIVNTVNSSKKVYREGEPVNLDNKVFNNSNGMTENDITLRLEVFRAGSSEKTASYEHNIGMIDPDDSISCYDAVSPEMLASGKYTAKARVLQGETELSQDETEFEVIADVAVINGELDLSGNGGTGRADANVTNSGNSDLENAELSVAVYRQGSEDPVYTVNETVSIRAGETIKINKDFELPDPSDGKYSGVLRASYNGKTTDLDYDGFDLTTGTAASTVTTVTTTAAATTTAKKSNSSKADSPKTGDRGIPAYMWLISVLSIASLVGLKMTGGSEDENK